MLLGFLYIGSRRNRVIYIAAIPVGIALFYFIFTIPKGILYSSFAIDLLMAVYFLADRKKLSPKLKLPIAITKLLGDACAGLYYAPESTFIGIIACLVLLCNIVYLYLCIKERTVQPEANRKKRK